jgi:membrane protein implicated in regulation of membrane protease activity
VRPAYLVLDLLLLVVLLVVVALLATLWLPLALLAVVVGLSLWLVRRYYLGYLDDLESPQER